MHRAAVHNDELTGLSGDPSRPSGESSAGGLNSRRRWPFTQTMHGAAPSLDSTRVLVLVVDDDDVARMLVAASLVEAGLDVVEASCGAEALEVFAAAPPDIVLLDVMMADMDGFQVCSRIRSMRGGGETPIVMMTGLEDRSSIDRAYDVGATDFVTKPVNHALLAHRLRYLLRAAQAFTDARQSATRLAHSQRLARIAQWEHDRDEKTFRWSAEAELIYGFPTSGTDIEHLFLRWVHPADRDRVARAIEGGPHTIEYRVVLPDGRVRVVHQDAELVSDPSTAHSMLQGAAQDITELREAERQVHDLAYFDRLTRLPNRALLRRFLDRSLEDSGRRGVHTAVLALDLDGFKRVNDTLGHAGGDELLRQVARRISSCTRSGDSVSWVDADIGSTDGSPNAMAARIGGDEFVVVVPDVRTPADAAIVARRIADKLAGNYLIGEAQVFISSSIGIATFPEDADGAEILLDRADIAMYHAKHSGRNQVQSYTPAMQETARARSEVEASLRAALDRASIVDGGSPDTPGGDHGFYLVYQPKVSVPSGTVVGVEALLRWASPERGPMSPADFIPIAEDTGLIVPLGAWVLRTACAQAKLWSLDPKTTLRIAVNVSARQFSEPGFAELVAQVLEETSLDPCLLELEITEGMVMEDTAASKRLLEELKAVGVRIALDDFGTGYSSLSYLAKLPIDALKIDRSFIGDLGKEGRQETITAAIIALSRSLAIDVVVEGVENAEQLEFVNRQGNTEVQGYFFARPMTADDLAIWRSRFGDGFSFHPRAA